MLAFTFHHSEDAPWVSVLESLFDAGFVLAATFPLRSDETKGEGSKPGTFGSQKIEYDIIHVCRQRNEESTPISWPKLRRQVLQDVRALKDMLEHHQEEGLPEADLQVIRRGKALEYFSRHYGKVFKDPDTPFSHTRTLGFTLAEIKELLGLWFDVNTKCVHVRQRAEQKITDIEDKIRLLQKMKRSLKKIISQCENRDAVDECPLWLGLDETRKKNAGD